MGKNFTHENIIFAQLKKILPSENYSLYGTFTPTLPHVYNATENHS